MTARLATAADLPDINKHLHLRGQVWAPEALKELLDTRHIAVVDPPAGFFWATLDESDRTLVHAGITFAKDDAQTRDLYKAALLEARKKWPEAATLKVSLDPARCQAQAYRGATEIARMEKKGQVDVWEEYEVKWTDLLAAVGVKAVR